MEKFDAIIIGCGQAGNPLSKELASQGWKTALIEENMLGGSCVNYGCTPTKAMISSGRIAHLIDKSEDYGVYSGEPEIIMEEVIDRKDNIVDSFRKGIQQSINDRENLTLFRGHGSFSDNKTIVIDLNEGGEKEIVGEKIFINTGLKPMIPPIEGLKEIDFHTSTSIMEIDELPEKLIIIGGGYIGIEFGQMFNRFGTDVAILQAGEQLMNREDKDMAEEVQTILEEDGIDLYLNTMAKEVSQEDEIRILAEIDGEKIEITGSDILVATGRVPNSDGLGLNNTDIEIDEQGYIQTDNSLETSVSGIYALGDIKGGPAFTHISYDDYRIVKDNLLKDRDSDIANRILPYTLYMDPQLGRVGLTEKEADEQGYSFKVAKMPMKRVARAIEVGKTRGMMKVIVDADTDKILGAAILGPEGGEIMSVIETAMIGELPYTALKDAVLSHPTFAESLNNLFSKLD